MEGFLFSEKSGSFDDDCSKINSYLSKLVIITSTHLKNKDDVKEYLEKCKNNKNDLIFHLNYIASSDNREESLLQILSTPGFGIKEKVRLRSIYKIKKKNRTRFSFWKELKTVIDFKLEGKEDKFETRSRNFQFLREQKKKLGKIKNPLFKNLFELSLAVQTNNTSWMIALSNKIIKSGPLELALTWNNQDEKVSKEEQIQLLKSLVTKLKGKVGDLLVVKILVDRLVQLGQSVEYKTLLNDFDADWSLTDLREITSSLGVAQEYFDFWYAKFVNRTSENEINQFLKRVLNIETINKAQASQLWIFQHYLPKDQKLRENITKRFEKMWASNYFYHRYIVLRSISLEPWKRLLIKKNSEFNRALFQLERDFFHEVLETGVAVDYALFQLYRLGDKDDQNLWWYVL